MSIYNGKNFQFSYGSLDDLRILEGVISNVVIDDYTVTIYTDLGTMITNRHSFDYNEPTRGWFKPNPGVGDEVYKNLQGAIWGTMKVKGLHEDG
jgi:hypothetical protein